MLYNFSLFIQIQSHQNAAFYVSISKCFLGEDLQTPDCRRGIPPPAPTPFATPLLNNIR
ncbi:hypothetical protein DPMN_129119 [Dreissena polymorpha]|uniref:Uncharacterized protein n=1 Tax=Dreissena polymorpha TaxID=45954 RepID=A0A9D4H563_DREPO|nr:hypothetical protein DPMN_129119 [Dreissena polymorpha]